MPRHAMRNAIETPRLDEKGAAHDTEAEKPALVYVTSGQEHVWKMTVSRKVIGRCFCGNPANSIAGAWTRDSHASFKWRRSMQRKKSGQRGQTSSDGRKRHTYERVATSTSRAQPRLGVEAESVDDSDIGRRLRRRHAQDVSRTPDERVMPNPWRWNVPTPVISAGKEPRERLKDEYLPWRQVISAPYLWPRTHLSPLLELSTVLR